jgi:hypothetical protein
MRAVPDCLHALNQVGAELASRSASHLLLPRRHVGRGGKHRKASSRLTIPDGKIVSKAFNPVGGRPYPSKGLSLENMIIVTMVRLTPNFLMTSTTIPTYYASSFALSDVPGYTSYISVFDQYKILQIEAWLEPESPQGTTSFRQLVTSVDLDDANLPSTTSSVADKPGALITEGGAGHYHSWVPHFAVASYSGTFTSYANTTGWIDSASSGVQHYGLKSAAQSTPAVVGYDATIRYTIAFRAPGIN